MKDKTFIRIIALSCVIVALFSTFSMNVFAARNRDEDPDKCTHEYSVTVYADPRNDWYVFTYTCTKCGHSETRLGALHGDAKAIFTSAFIAAAPDTEMK